MGHGMAANLIAGGHEVAVIAHRNRQPIEDLVLRGASEAGNYADLLQARDTIILCVTNASVVESIVDALVPHLCAGQMVIDTSTSLPATSRSLALKLAALDVIMIEAPVMGGAQQAANGELGAMVGADTRALDAARPVLDCFCSRISHFGPPGAGAEAKLLSNYLVFAMVAAISETYNLASDAGIAWNKLYDVMACGSNNSEALRRIVGSALGNDFDGYRFTVTGARKDMGYFMELAQTMGGPSKLAEAVMETYERAHQAGLGDLNVSRLIDPRLRHKG